MPFEVTHILTGILIIEIFREYILKQNFINFLTKKKVKKNESVNNKFPRYYILIAVIGSILPDIDIVIDIFLKNDNFLIHRTFFHSLFFPLIFILLSGFYFNKKNLKILQRKHLKISYSLFIIGIMIFIHIFLDFIFAGKVYLFFPINNNYYGLDLISNLPKEIGELFFPVLDGVLLFIWILWMEFKLKIRQYM